MSTSAPDREYVLGTDTDELIRLGWQARIWSDDAIALWKLAGFRPGHAVLDVGSGPGFATRDLAGLVGPNGRVLAIDESQRFLDFLSQAEQPPHAAPIQTQCSDAQSMSLEHHVFDGAYMRWVLCFVKDPLAVIRNVAQALRPGGVFAIQDYINYGAMTWGPNSTTARTVVGATIQSWESRGGDSNIGLRLPSLLAQAGLEVYHVRALGKTSRPGDSLWHWPTAFFEVFVPKLVSMNLLTQKQADDYFAEWRRLSNDPNAVFHAPNVVEVVARKK